MSPKKPRKKRAPAFTVTEIPVTAWKILPPPKDKCQECATDHLPDQPHNAQSIYYGTKRRIEGHTTANWKDAMGHCSPEVQAAWKEKLVDFGVDVEGGKVHPAKKS